MKFNKKIISVFLLTFVTAFLFLSMVIYSLKKVGNEIENKGLKNILHDVWEGKK